MTAMSDQANELPFTVTDLAEAIAAERYQWQAHAVRRALQRGLGDDDVHGAIRAGSIIESYPDDEPLPSALVLGYNGNVPVHIVVAYDVLERMLFIITVYVPDREHFEADHRTRRCNPDE